VHFEAGGGKDIPWVMVPTSGSWNKDSYTLSSEASGVGTTRFKRTLCNGGFVGRILPYLLPRSISERRDPTCWLGDQPSAQSLAQK